MKRMIPFALIIVVGLAVSVWILRREIRRTSLEKVAPKAELREFDQWQRAIRLAPPGDYKSGHDAEWREKLRREEERQRPQEERN